MTKLTIPPFHCLFYGGNTTKRSSYTSSNAFLKHHLNQRHHKRSISSKKTPHNNLMQCFFNLYPIHHLTLDQAYNLRLQSIYFRHSIIEIHEYHCHIMLGSVLPLHLYHNLSNFQNLGKKL